MNIHLIIEDLGKIKIKKVNWFCGDGIADIIKIGETILKEKHLEMIVEALKKSDITVTIAVKKS